jgi:hypothetical protein
MKSATVPAQVTTIEDKIAGNLTLQQIVLLASPVFIDFALYVVMPTTLKLNAYKLVIMAIVTASSAILAIRVKSKILLVWAVTICRYNARPRHYVFNKNNVHLRAEAPVPVHEAQVRTIPDTEQSNQQVLRLPSDEDILKLECILTDPLTNLSFATSKKGGLRVSISEIQ